MKSAIFLFRMRIWSDNMTSSRFTDRNEHVDFDQNILFAETAILTASLVEAGTWKENNLVKYNNFEYVSEQPYEHSMLDNELVSAICKFMSIYLISSFIKFKINQAKVVVSLFFCVCVFLLCKYLWATIAQDNLSLYLFCSNKLVDRQIHIYQYSMH